MARATMPVSPTEISVATATVTERHGTPSYPYMQGGSRSERRRGVVIAAFVPAPFSSDCATVLCHEAVVAQTCWSEGRVGVSECQDALVARSTRRVAIAPGRPSQLARGRLYDRRQPKAGVALAARAVSNLSSAKAT